MGVRGGPWRSVGVRGGPRPIEKRALLIKDAENLVKSMFRGIGHVVSAVFRDWPCGPKGRKLRNFR